ncbi:MAG: hypothetical protein ACI9IV_001336 [Paracoccaceae bacterium]|jgi:hypothetical protein
MCRDPHDTVKDQSDTTPPVTAIPQESGTTARFLRQAGHMKVEVNVVDREHEPRLFDPARWRLAREI